MFCRKDRAEFSLSGFERLCTGSTGRRAEVLLRSPIRGIIRNVSYSITMPSLP
uniref:Uncharacterized protein n=1 Tax=Anguilla anguilla TaxID=7936 RepID=A0A0E9PMG2_ANGAN